MNRRTALALAGAAAFARPRIARAADPMRLAAPALDAVALMFYADQAGYLKNAGLDYNLQAMPNGEAVTVAVAGNAVDIGASEVVSLILAYKRGIPITLLAPSGEQTATSDVGMLFARDGVKVANGADLNGKTVAVVGLNGFAQFGTQHWIDANGGDSRSVRFIQLAGAQIGVALQDGRIDAAFVPEPFVSVVKKVAPIVANSMASIAPMFLSGAHFALLPYARANADAIRRFQGALRQTAAWANANPAKTAVILEGVSHVSPELITASTRAHFAEALEPGLVQPLIDLAAKYGHIERFSASEMVFRA